MDALVGRQREIAILASTAGRFDLVSVVGAPGIGKSTLVRRWAPADAVWLDLAEADDPVHALGVATGVGRASGLADALALRRPLLDPRRR